MSNRAKDEIANCLVYGLGGSAFVSFFAIIKSIKYGPLNVEFFLAFGVIGFCVGIMAAPLLDRKAFKNPTMVQIISGAVLGFSIGIYVYDDLALILSAVIIGAFVGATSSFWLKHVK